jgi:uncharacterized protein YecE (DUF72 family)
VAPYDVPTNPTLRLGTCSFTADGWVGSFYPKGLPSKEHLGFYAGEFDTVELDVTFYRIPTQRMIESWYERTPESFVFAAKAPRAITHEKRLLDCEGETQAFLSAMQGLGTKLGPILFQFPYFNRSKFKSLDGFLLRLEPFLKSLPRGLRYAVEVRNKGWINVKLTELLGTYGVALAVIDQAWMHSPKKIFESVDPVTADFTYLRWLGDRHGIEEITKTWDKTILDRDSELRDWADLCQPIRTRGVTIYGYVNNHFAGHSPATIRRLLDLMEPSVRRENAKPRTVVEPPTLFEM